MRLNHCVFNTIKTNKTLNLMIHMNCRPKISHIFSLLLGLMFYGAIGYAQVKTAPSTEQNKSATYAGKTSSSNIHIDDIAIKISPDTQTVNSVISEEDHKRLVSKLSDDAKEEVISWIKRQWWLTDIFGIAVIITMILSIWAAIKISVHLIVDKHVSKSIEVTNKTIYEIELAQETLKDFRKKRNDLNKKLEGFQDKVDEEIEKYNSIKETLDSNIVKSVERTTDETYELENKIKYLKLIINEIDKDDAAKNKIVNKLITDLKSDDKETKYSAVELLPQSELESNNITSAFVNALKNTQDKTFSSVLISEFGKLKCDDETLKYLLELLDSLNDTNILFIIGSLGELGEIGKDKITDAALESIVDKLLLILNSDLDNKEFASDITASQVRSAIALAFSYYGYKAVKAVKPLISLLSDKDQEVRKNAAIALGTIGAKAKDAILALRRLENDEDAEVRFAVSEAIEKIQQTA